MYTILGMGLESDQAGFLEGEAGGPDHAGFVSKAGGDNAEVIFEGAAQLADE